MPLVLKGVMQAPVTPLKEDFGLDLPTLEKAADFHVRTSATRIAQPYHKSESLNMTVAERKAGGQAVVKAVAGRVPVVIHVSALAVEDSLELARHAQSIGADGVVAITPYFWNPSPQAIFDYPAQAGATAVVAATPYYWAPPVGMLLEHFTQIGRDAGIPFFVYNSPGEMGGVKVTTNLALKLIDRIENFAGVIDASLDWQFMIEVLSSARHVRPVFQLLTGVEYMISAGAIRATGMFSSLAGIAPVAVHTLW